MEEFETRLVCGRGKFPGQTGEVFGRRRRESHSGQAKAAHDEAAAEKSLQEAMAVLELSADALKQMPKSAPENVVLAWWLRQRTTVPLLWVNERLVMGHYSRVSQAIGQLKRRLGRKHQRLRRKLMAHQQTPP
jgi:hypothetical protein